MMRWRPGTVHRKQWATLKREHNEDRVRLIITFCRESLKKGAGYQHGEVNGCILEQGRPCHRAISCGWDF